MKSLLLCKQTDSPVVAHIYEHIVMGALKQLMWQHRLLRHIDYSALGTHYMQTGFLSIAVDLYSNEATALESELQDLQISLTDDVINRAIWQITAETKQDTLTTNPAILRNHLQTLHLIPWQSIDTMRDPIIIDYPPEHHTLQTKRTTRQITRTTYTLSKPLPDNIALVPLFHFLTTAIHDTAAETANSQLGYYNFGGQFKYQPGRMLHTNTIAALREVTDDIAVRRIYYDVIRELSKTNTIARIITRARAFSLRQNSFAESSIDDYVQDVNVLIGKKIWYDITTKANICRLLNGIRLD